MKLYIQQIFSFDLYFKYKKFAAYLYRLMREKVFKFITGQINAGEPYVGNKEECENT